MSDQANCAPGALASHSRVSSIVLVWIGFLAVGCVPACAYSPESPEVRAVINKALAFLETENDPRLGGQCLVALAFHKAGISHEHPRIVEAIKACQEAKIEDLLNDSLYSHALAIILLAELDPVKYRGEIEKLSNAMAARQKPHGGWGYKAFETGDTSQTQYAILSYWELMQVGLTPQVSSVEKAANWLLRTQDPSGCWGYQGLDPGSFQLREQNQTTLSMLAAGLGSTLISANILGALEPGGDATTSDQTSATGNALPSALREAKIDQPKAIKKLSGGSIDKAQLKEAIANGQEWFNDHFEQRGHSEYPYYLLYSVERYKSFEEFLSGEADTELDWYQSGFQEIRSQQKENGSLNSQAKPPCATAFAVLFLVRSTQQSIKASLGQGTLVGGRGLTANLARMKLQNGRLVTERQPTQVDKFLEMLDSEESGKFESLMADTAVIDVENITPADIHRLEQLVKTGNPDSRLLAVQALGKLRNLDYVPSLLFAITDPDKRVVRAARDALKYVSRRFDGYGPPDNFTKPEQYDAREAWKSWYKRVRPEATFVP